MKIQIQFKDAASADFYVQHLGLTRLKPNKVDVQFVEFEFDDCRRANIIIDDVIDDMSQADEDREMTRCVIEP